MNRIFELNKTLFGSGPLKFEWQKSTGLFLAAVGSSRSVYIFDRQSTKVDTFQIPGDCTALEWSPEGDILAVAQDKSGVIFFWDASAKKLSSQLDTALKNIEFMQWSARGDSLAVGTGKGNLFLYERQTSKKTPILGKHTKGIIAMAWSPAGVLACGSEDKTFTLSDAAGDTTFQMSLKGEPTQLEWSSMRTSADAPNDTILSMLLSQKTMFLHNMNSPESPIELAFQARYGQIVRYKWFGDGHIMIGFSNGYVIVISTNMDEIGQELFQSRNHKDSLVDIAVSEKAGKAATCGGDCVKIHDLSDMKDVYAIINLDDDRGQIDRLKWSTDGKFLTISTKTGSLYTYLTSYPVLGDSCGMSVAWLTGLREVSITNDGTAGSSTTPLPTFKYNLDNEPNAVAIGPTHVATTAGNIGFFYARAAGDMDSGAYEQPPTLKREYAGTVNSIRLNTSTAAVLLSDGRVQAHKIAKSESGRPQPQVTFPPKDLLPRLQTSSTSIVSISALALTPEFLIYGTNTGFICHNVVDEWALVSNHAHKKGIKAIFPQQKGVKVIFMDEAGEGFVYNPVNDQVVSIPNCTKKTEGALWETPSLAKSSSQQYQRSVFLTYDDAHITIYAYEPWSLRGPQCVALGSTKRPFGLKPLLFSSSGTVTCQTQSGKLSMLKLSTHEEVKDFGRLEDANKAAKTLQLLYMLNRHEELWKLVSVVKNKKPWEALSNMALDVFDITTAKRIHRQVFSDPATVMSLERIELIDDKNLLAGHVALFFGEYNLAQDFFLNSSQPIAALDLRRDLLQWDQALTLAETLAPDQVTIISREYAQQLEFNGKFSDALHQYERALSTSESFPGTTKQQEDHQITCSSGMARMTLRMGDITRGMKMLSVTKDKSLLAECGSIMEGLKQYTEAGLLFERAQSFERAAEVYLKAKNYAKVAEILPNVTTPKIHAQYAKAREAEGKFEDAAKAYERARDFDNVVRLYVEKLHNIEGAVAIVRRTKSRDSAKLISKFFQTMKDYRSTVEFCLVAGMKDEAFELAQQHNVMEIYAEAVKDEASQEELKNIAAYFESKNQFMLAGKYLLQANNHRKALEMFLQSPPTADGKNIEMAIDTVGIAKDESLIHILIDFLMGENDGEPKDAKYIFKLYMSLGQYKEAGRTAVIIAREEQTLGNYRTAHDLLLDNLRQLRKVPDCKVPLEMEKMLMLLHSYVLVKILVRIDDHEGAAKMLVRVAKNISKFPAHVVPILTSTVIECHRAGLNKSAFEYAAMLMRPEYRNKIDEKYKRKIEQIVRRPSKEEPEEPTRPCPYCDTPLTETELDCGECKNFLPYCIATGKHMTLLNFTTCPSCSFPALFPDFKALLEKTNGTCPMCTETIALEKLVVIKDAKEYLKKLNNLSEDDEGKTTVDGDDERLLKMAKGKENANILIDNGDNSVSSSMENVKKSTETSGGMGVGGLVI